ncbi:MAG TPA: hypothetical protein DE310_00815 [Alphaproteobacteria bacterium]|nr:hypothetical protein [Alphaproteobacteria bacterium]
MDAIAGSSSVSIIAWRRAAISVSVRPAFADAMASFSQLPTSSGAASTAARASSKPASRSALSCSAEFAMAAISAVRSASGRSGRSARPSAR